MSIRHDASACYVHTTTRGVFVQFRTDYFGSRFDNHYTRSISIVAVESGKLRIITTPVKGRLIHQMHRYSRFCGKHFQVLSKPNDAEKKEIVSIAEEIGLKMYRCPDAKLLSSLHLELPHICAGVTAVNVPTKVQAPG